MAKITTANQSTSTTPSSGYSSTFTDATTKRLATIDDAGVYKGFLGKTNSTTTQALGSAADTYITNSGITIPAFGMVAGMMFRWNIGYVQTATTQTLAIKIRIGTGVIGDTDISNALATTITTGATATGGIIQVGYMVHTIGASGTGFDWYEFTFGQGTIQSADSKTTTTFDNTARAGQKVGISITPSGTVGTIQGVHGELIS